LADKAFVKAETGKYAAPKIRSLSVVAQRERLVKVSPRTFEIASPVGHLCLKVFHTRSKCASRAQLLKMPGRILTLFEDHLRDLQESLRLSFGVTDGGCQLTSMLCQGPRLIEVAGVTTVVGKVEECLHESNGLVCRLGLADDQGQRVGYTFECVFVVL